ncbi:MAG: L-histidine N(alpha)-methyltransferase [Bacteroidota bacterium]|nr:L-histidine N(alpha)-methyltransferase [Bacteroidota bacterium]
MTTTPPNTIAEVVISGLEKTPKRLPSWLFYDEHGDALFQRIMALPEYYLTDCEFEILRQQSDQLYDIFQTKDRNVDLIELGAGDGTKTEVLLRHLQDRGLPFTYRPTDVSGNILKHVKDRLSKNLPNLPVDPIQGIHRDVLPALSGPSEKRKVILFLGASIGNYEMENARTFFQWVAGSLSGDDLFVVGFDLKKDPKLIKAAYDDPQGVTREFNLNLLRRLNRELGANFMLDQWDHYPLYDPESGEARSYLYSKKPQKVQFELLDRSFDFDHAELIQTEISQKYDQNMIKDLAGSADLECIQTLFDCRHFFCLSVFRSLRTKD